VTNPDLKISGVRRLGEALGIPKTKAAELAKEPWFPKKGPDGSWSTAEVQRAYAAFKEGKIGATGTRAGPSLGPGNPFNYIPSIPTAPPASPGAPVVLVLDDDALRNVLETSGDPEEIAKALIQLVARSVARAGAQPAMKDVVALKMTLEELRRTIAGHLEIAKEKGEVITRSVAISVIGQLGRRAISLMERYEVQLAAKVEAWFSDPAFRNATSEERAREIRAWAADQTHSMRKIEADDVEKLVAAEAKEQAE
jgi:hypothetical protein